MSLFQNKSLTALMIISQIVLTVFVVQWLFTQYNNEKSVLQVTLNQQYEKSQQEVLDSILEEKLITPLLKNKNGFKISFQEKIIDSVSENGKLKMFINKTESFDSTRLVTVLTDTISHQNNKDVSNLTDSSNDILLHGVRLIVKEITTTPGYQQEFDHRLYSGSDTTLLKSVLLQRYKGNGWNFNTRWVGKKQFDSSGQHDKIIYMESKIFPKKYGLEITGYRLYLFKKILPQSFFAVILLMLTGLAFLFSYRTLKNQLRLNEMKNDFIDNISHELKTPLSTVKVVVEALQDENIRKDEKTTKEYLQMASIEINRLELLTGKILSSSMMESGIIKMQKQEINLLTLTTDLVYALKVRLTNENAELSIDASAREYFISGDPLHIQGALLNLIDNSLKYSGNHPIIKITLNNTHAGIQLSVMDNGPGIPNEYLGKIFDKFFRLPSGNLHNVKGHGLGLSYVAMVMKMHGGSVVVENNSSGGCIFKLVFSENAK